MTYTPASAAGILFARRALDLALEAGHTESAKLLQEGDYSAVQAKMGRLQRGRKRSQLRKKKFN